MKKGICVILLQLSVICRISQIQIKEALRENRVNPVGLDVSQPELSCQLISAVRNTMQTAYEVSVAESLSDLVKSKNMVWNSGKVLSEQSAHLTYTGSTSQSAKKYYWRVRVWDNKRNVSTWSEPSFWQMGFLKQEDWKAKWIQAGYQEDTI